MTRKELEQMLLEGKHNEIGEATDNGICYKDLDAWYVGNPDEDIIYIGEYELEHIVPRECWTKTSWLFWVKETVKDIIPDITNEELEYIAYNVLLICDWQELSTELESWNWENAILEMRNEQKTNN